MHCKLSVLSVALLVATPSWAINKCVSADGKVSYQAQPCSGGTSKTINIQAAPTAEAKSNATPKSAESGAQTSEQRTLAGFERERRIRELKDEIAGLERVIDSRNRRMQVEMESLRYRKSFANNNLAGATYEQSLSTEMQAVATRYKAQNEVEFERIRALRTELSGLQSAKP